MKMITVKGIIRRIRKCKCVQHGGRVCGMCIDLMDELEKRAEVE